MTNRDPRIDPKPGDSLLGGPSSRRRRIVTKVETVDGVNHVWTHVYYNNAGRCLLAGWRKWAEDATVETTK